MGIKIQLIQFIDKNHTFVGTRNGKVIGSAGSWIWFQIVEKHCPFMSKASVSSGSLWELKAIKWRGVAGVICWVCLGGSHKDNGQFMSWSIGWAINISKWKWGVRRVRQHKYRSGMGEVSLSLWCEATYCQGWAIFKELDVLNSWVQRMGINPRKNYTGDWHGTAVKVTITKAMVILA